MIDVVAAHLARRNSMSFDELESQTGLTRNELIAMKSDVEATLRRDDPRLRLTSRVDLSPEGFEVTD
jgi:hypothetical protein